MAGSSRSASGAGATDGGRDHSGAVRRLRGQAIGHSWRAPAPARTGHAHCPAGGDSIEAQRRWPPASTPGENGAPTSGSTPGRGRTASATRSIASGVVGAPDARDRRSSDDAPTPQAPQPPPRHGERPRTRQRQTYADIDCRPRAMSRLHHRRHRALGFGLAVRLGRARVPVVIGSRDSRAGPAGGRPRARPRSPRASSAASERRGGHRGAEIVILSVPFRSQSETLTNLKHAFEPRTSW